MKENKIFLALIAGVLLGFMIGISNGVRRMLDSTKDKNRQNTVQKSERDLQWDEEEKIKKQFDVDFAFVCERIAQRDLEIYSLAEKRDREILAEVEQLSLPTNQPNEYRVKLETWLKWRLNHHIKDCIRFRSRIQEGRGLFRTSAYYCRADIYQTKCDCECCNKD